MPGISNDYLIDSLKPGIWISEPYLGLKRIEMFDQWIVNQGLEVIQLCSASALVYEWIEAAEWVAEIFWIWIWPNWAQKECAYKLFINVNELITDG